MKIGHHKRNERGQVAVLFALVFTFMFVLFAMVVDITHLVNNKINLQLAADSAAYAGAAWQARVLNRMAQINYRMRQDLKELAMRVQVTHLRHNRNFPRGSDVITGAPGTSDVDAFLCQQAHGYVSLSGIRYAANTNLCRNASAVTGGLPPIVVPPVIAAFDPFEVAIAAQIRKIADAADQQCAAAAEDNRILSEHLARVYTERSQFHEQQMLQLQQFLNDTPSGAVTDNTAHPIAQTAYQSAKRNLTPANVPGFQMQILQPQGGYIQLNEQKLGASILFIRFQTVGDGCVGQPGFFDFNDMVAGMSKERELVTYFAVKLSATPDLLFIPQAWLNAAQGSGLGFPRMEAFAAAKPFGSRIGPERGIDRLEPVSGRLGNQSRILNFSFKPHDNLGMMNRKIMALFDAFHPINSESRPDGNQQTGWPDPNRGGQLAAALRLIHAPTIFDSIFYTIFPDPGDNAANDYLEPQFAAPLYPDYMEAYNPSNGQVLEGPALTPSTPPYFQTSGFRGQGYFRISDPGNNNTSDGYGSYASEAPESHGLTTALGLPFLDTSDKMRDLGFADKTLVHSGWTPQRMVNGHERIGYSVKFVGFDALTGKLQVTTSDGGQVNIANPPQGDPNLVHIIH